MNAALCSGVDVHLEAMARPSAATSTSPTPDFDDAALGRSGSPSACTTKSARATCPASVRRHGEQQRRASPAFLPRDDRSAVGLSTTDRGTARHDEGGVRHDARHTHGAAVELGRVVWLDDDSALGNGIASYDVDALAGRASLYVDGDLHLTGAVAYRDRSTSRVISPQASGAVVGAVVVHGRSESTTTLTDGPPWFYSRDAINRALGAPCGKSSRFPGEVVRRAARAGRRVAVQSHADASRFVLLGIWP